MVPAGARLRHGDGGDLGAGRHCRDEALDLLRRAVVGDVRHHDVRVDPEPGTAARAEPPGDTGTVSRHAAATAADGTC